MSYTEIKQRNGRRYFYRVLSVREGNKVRKIRKYVGVNLMPEELSNLEMEVDGEIMRAKVNKNIEKLKLKILEVLKKHHIRKASIFGSYARGEQNKNSDIDILIEPPKEMGFEFVTISFDLEKKLGKKVDLLTYNGISPHLKKYILEDEVRIL